MNGAPAEGSGPRVERVLVAGATEYLGRHLVERLKTEGCWVRVLVRSPEQASLFDAVDEVFVGQVTEPSTLAGIAEGIDTVFSSLGITRQRDGVGYEQVDFGGNLALLREAERSGVRRFLYVSVLHGAQLRDRVRLLAAKERFVDALAASPIAHTIVRPTGYFSDMAAFLTMAMKASVMLVGDGRRRMNPISGKDLAAACVMAARAGTAELELGGPDVFTHRQIAVSAFEAAGRAVRIRRLPLWLARAMVAVLRVLTPQSVYGPFQFFVAVMGMDMVGETKGSEHLAEYFRERHVQLTAPSARPTSTP